MSSMREVTKHVAAPATSRPPAPLAPGSAPGPAVRPLGERLRNELLPRAAWRIKRTGRPGLFGLALLLACAIFFLSTHLPVAGEVEALRAQVEAAQQQAPIGAADRLAEAVAPTRVLPARTDMPELLRQIFAKSAQAGLKTDSGKYEVATVKGSSVVRYQITFPVTGTYPQVRAFIDTLLATMPAVALTELIVDRKSIEDAIVEAQLRLTVFTGSGP